MRVLISAIGKMKAGPELELCHSYIRRLSWQVDIKESDAKKSLPAKEKQIQESELLLASCKGYDVVVALDEDGKTPSSQEFAAQLKTWQVGGKSKVAFLIGGSDGHTDALLKASHMQLSLGKMTWPHMLARAMLCEQLYRAHAILAGHPYHRE